MTRRSALGVAAALVAAVSMHIIVSAQSSVGPNVNVVTGIADQFIGDMLRQRQNESVLGISSINPDHMVVAYNDYRTVDFAADQGIGTPAGQRTLFARLRDFLTWPLKREARREASEEADAGQAWVGLSFSDNGGATWYTGLLPGHPFGISPEDVGSPLRAYEAASDPVTAFTPNQFFIGGIAFTPGAGSAGFVARLTDLNKSERGQNLHYDFTRIVLSVPDATRFVDKPSIAAGPNGHVYAAFVVFDNTDPRGLSSTIQLFRSTDFGSTWSTGVTLNSPRTRNQAPLLLVDPNDEQILHMIWRVFSSETGGAPEVIVYRRSTDGGATFTPGAPMPIAANLRAFDQPQVALNTTSNPIRLPIPRSNAYPTGAIDGNGTMHVALQEWVNPATGAPVSSGGVPRVTVMSSRGGLGWTPRQAIDFGPGTGTQFMPVLTTVGEPGPSCGSAGPRSRIYVMYYDARAAVTNGYVVGGGSQFDVRIAEASACNLIGGRPAFAASQQMSRYSIDPRTKQIARTAGYDYAAVNRALEMFCGGNCSFTGDYIHLIPRVPYVNTGNGWKATTAVGVDQARLPSPVVKGMWADTRDVIYPTTPPPQFVPGPTFIDGLAWWNYQVPGTGNLPGACHNAGSRDQNIYGAEYSSANLFAAAPVTFRVSTAPHSYPVYIENRAATRRFFRLTIDPGSNATFNVPGDGAPDRVADIAIGPYSTVTGSVVVGVNVSTPIPIAVAETTAIGGPLLPNGASTIVVLNTSGEATSLIETHQPIVDATPTVTKPFQDAGVSLPITVCGTSTTGCTPRTDFANPFTDNPFTDNPFTDNPFTDNPFTDNPFTDNVTVHDVTDVSFAITNGGDAAAAFAAMVAVRSQLKTSGSYVFKGFVNRVGQNPGLNGCQTTETVRDVQISTIKNPFTDNPFTDNPFTDNPFTDNPFTDNPFTDNASPSERVGVSNSTFYLAPPAAPGETASIPSRDGAQRLASAGRNAARIRPAAFGVGAAATPVPTTTKWRDDRPDDKVIWTLRAYQIKASNAPGFTPLNPPTDVGVLVTANTPNIILVGGVPQFDPAGPPSATGGATIPVKLTILQQPTSAPPSAPIAPPIQVAIQDGFGNTMTSSTLPVTLSIGSNPGSGTLSGTLTRNAVNGIATFDDVSINLSGTGYTLVASSPNLASATTSTFDILVACYAGSAVIQSPLTAPGVSTEPLVSRLIRGIGGGRNLVTLSGDGTISMQTNDGGGHFTTSSSATIAATSGPRDLRVADVDLDGNHDLIVAYDSGGVGNNLAIVRTDGTGGWIDTNVASTGSIAAVVAGQLDPGNDAFPDLAYLIRSSNQGRAWMGDGNVPFSAPKLKAFTLTGTEPVALALARMNADAYPDLVVLDRGTNSVEVLLNDGSANFSSSSVSPLGGLGLRTPSDSPGALAIGDFNEDGMLDVAVASDAAAVQEGQAVMVFSGNGDGTLAAGAPARFPIGAGPLGLAVGDLNNDGHLDIATVNPGDNSMSLLFGDGAGGFGAPISASAGNTSRGIDVGDFTHDGLDDLIVANRFHRPAIAYDEVTLLPFPCAGTGPFHVTSTADAGPGTLRQAILNANSKAGAHEITFNLSGGGPYVIALASQLPAAMNPVDVDATSQPGFTGIPLVEVNGSGLGAGAIGLNLLGGSSTVRGLSIFGFQDSAIRLGSDGNVVSSNYVGLHPNGAAVASAPAPNSVGVLSAGNNVIGGTGPRARNVLTGYGYGAFLGGIGVSWAMGNFIGTTPDGMATGVTDMAPWGVFLGGTGHVIGGQAPGRRNLISGVTVGIFVPVGSGMGALIQGNWIGLDATGNAVLPTIVNSFGVEIQGALVTVGGATQAAGNTVSGYHTQIYGGYGGSNVIQNNNVGSDAAGIVALAASVPNTAGVYLTSSNNTVTGNYIVGHGQTGVAITSTESLGISASNNVVQFNRIISNPGTGIMLTRDASAFGVGNNLVPNVWANNGQLAIDLDLDGVTTNDAFDLDTGTNGLQNYPVLTSASPTTIAGSLSSTPNTQFTIHFFSNSACAPSGFGEGGTHIGTMQVTTNGSGFVSFADSSFALSVGQAVTATATSPTASTSEFSQCVTVMAAPPPPGPTTFLVINTNDSGGGSLRQAILDANGDPDVNEIVFSIPGPGPHVIAPTSALPNITAPVLIDATTQPGYAGVPVVKLNGAGAGASANGLTLLLGGKSSLVRGFAIGNFAGDGVTVSTPGNTIVSNYIGIDIDGVTPVANGFNAVTIGSGQATGNAVGGATAAERNILSGNGANGVLITGSAGFNRVEGNFIGTASPGSTPVPNAFAGVMLGNNAHHNTIGAFGGGTGNVIAGNAARGVYIQDSNQNSVVGNLIGTSVSGTVAIPNGLVGVHATGTASFNRIGTTKTLDRNVISGHTFGVLLESAGVTGNTVQGNRIGTTSSGLLQLGNTNGGVVIFNSAFANTIGGPTAGAGNLISGNGMFGVQVNNGDGNRIYGNIIGRNLTNSAPLPNSGDGVQVYGNDNAIGAAGAAANTIASNTGRGVVIGSGVNNASVFNSIFGNTGIGIDLGDDGVSTNGIPNATDANHSPNYPGGISASASTATVNAELFGAAGTTYTIQIFESDTSNFEGKTLVRSMTVTTDSPAGHAFINAAGLSLTVGKYVTLTATDPSGNTSEFSAPVVVGP